MSTEPQTLLRKIVSDGQRIGIETAYSDPEFVGQYRSEARNFRGAWFPEPKFWVFSKREGRSFLESLWSKFPEKFPPEIVGQILEEATSSPDPYALIPLLQIKVFPTEDGKTVLLSRYDPVTPFILRKIGGKWDEKHKFWIFEERSENVLANLETIGKINSENMLLYPNPVSISKLVSGQGPAIDFSGFMGECLKGGTHTPGQRNLRFVPFMTPLKKEPVSDDLLANLTKKYGLMDHQIAAVRHLLSSTSSLLADDMGLGKTRSSLVATIAAGGRTLIICPAGLRTNWKREILILKEPEESIHVVVSSDTPIPPRAKWVIVSYESAENLVFTKQKFQNMIVDEAHYIKELKSDRTKNAFFVAAGIPRRILISATPIMNREAEIHTLLEFSGHPLGQMDRKEFLGLYAKSTEARSLLAERMNEWILRRTRDQAIQLPKRQILSPTIDPAPHFIEDYKKIVADVTLLPLQKESRLRHLLEVAHAEYILSELPEVVASHKSVIFCELVEVLEHIMKRLEAMGIGAVRISGADRDRYSSIDAFQEDPEVRVMVAILKGASEGLNLTAGTYAWFCTIPYGPTQLDQAMARIYRIGQKRDVTVVTPIVPDTIDIKTLAIVERKRKIISDIGL